MINNFTTIKNITSSFDIPCSIFDIHFLNPESEIQNALYYEPLK